MDLWAAIVDERTSILNTFEGLSAEQWEQPSLCGQWTIRQVLGHLVVAADPPTGGFVQALVKARGSFDKANDAVARAEAECSTDELMARYRDRIRARKTPPGFGPKAPLSDVIVHSLDVRVPLGIASDRPVERYEIALGLLLGTLGGRTFVPKGRPAVRWVATDHAWAHGSGDEVHGAMVDLTLAASGRGARVDALRGPGVAALASWLSR